MTAEDFQSETEITPKNDVILVRLSGHLDAHTFERVESVFQDLFDRDCFKLIVDLGAIDYLSSAGVGAFFNAISQARENGGNIVLTNASPTVCEVLNVLGLSQIFQIADDYDSALKAF